MSDEEIKVGDQLRDNDPRMSGRMLTVIQILPNGVAAQDRAGRVFTFLRRRIHTDGKSRRSGFDLFRARSLDRAEAIAAERST